MAETSQPFRFGLVFTARGAVTIAGQIVPGEHTNIVVCVSEGRKYDYPPKSVILSWAVNVLADKARARNVIKIKESLCMRTSDGHRDPSQKSYNGTLRKCEAGSDKENSRFDDTALGRRVRLLEVSSAQTKSCGWAAAAWRTGIADSFSHRASIRRT